MATLTGQQINTTYDSLLKLSDNDGISSTKKTITDGLGADTPISISETEVVFDVVVEADGFKTPTGTSLDFLMADGSTSSGSSGDAHYAHTQGIASASWTVTHNLGKFPSVTVIDSANNVVVGEIQYTNNNSLTISFTSTFSGKAYTN